MAQLVYLDETGSVGKGAAGQPLLTLVAVIVDEEQVQPLGEAMAEVARAHVDWADAREFEFHGNELWGAGGPWEGKTPGELIAAYEAVLGLLTQFELPVAYASIHKQKLHDSYRGDADANAYRLALQFLLEKLDSYSQQKKIVVADEAKAEALRAIRMVADLQQWGGGEVPGKKLETVIDSLHFVRSQDSPGVQLADLVAFVMQRYEGRRDTHPKAKAAIGRLHAVVVDQLATWREPWPR